jgi:hypothetical protein
MGEKVGFHERAHRRSALPLCTLGSANRAKCKKNMNYFAFRSVCTTFVPKIGASWKKRRFLPYRRNTQTA